MLGPRHWPYRFSLRLRSLFRRNEVARDLEDEIAFHLAMQAEANRQAGMSEHEAIRAAYRQFGGVAQEQEACRDRIFGGSGSMGSCLLLSSNARGKSASGWHWRRKSRRSNGSSYDRV